MTTNKIYDTLLNAMNKRYKGRVIEKKKIQLYWKVY